MGKTPLSLINHTHIIFILKQSNASSLDNFRLISIYSESYKIFALIITKRLKPLLPKCTRKKVVTFVQNRQIMDNVILAKEYIKSITSEIVQGLP